MNALIFDTETTGFPQKSKNPGDPCQPHLVQLGAIMFDTECLKIRAELNLIIRPDGYEIPQQCSDIHGITTVDAKKHGVPLQVAVAMFNQLASLCEAFVCHNLEFDSWIMCIAYKRMNKPHPFTPDDRQLICTMQELTPIMNLPPTPKMVAAGFNKPKAPNLTEAAKFIGRGEFAAHDGMADARETLALYQWLLEQKLAA